MGKIVNIKPFEQVKTTLITSVDVSVMRIELFKGAMFHVSLMDSNGGTVDSKVVEITGDDYKKWGGDDDFIYQYIAKQLGFSMLENEVVVTPVEIQVQVPIETPVQVPIETPVETPLDESAPTSE